MTALHTVRHDHLDFNCRLDGTEGAPWMVFSNSLATNLSLWDHQVAHFAARFRILRYDQRGHGGTTVPPAPADLTQLADDAEALMAHFGVTGATFVGVSLGAATGLCLAPRLRSPIARLLAADGNAATPPGGAQAWSDRLAATTQGPLDGMQAFADLTLPRWFATDPAHPAIPLVRTMIQTTPRPGLECCVAALQAYDVTATLAAIAQPTLFVAGAADGAMPATMATLQHQVPGARLTIIPAAGHLPCIEQPEAFNAALESLLA